MGHLYYGSEPEPLEFPDDVLAHVKVVIATKLRRGESFTLSWQHGPGEKPGRSTVWIQPSIPLRFVFDSPEPAKLDPALLTKLAQDAHATAGITLTVAAEPAAVLRDKQSAAA